jgi:hypothetical protein
MTIVHASLKQRPALGPPQRQCLATLFVTLLVLRGRVNFRNLSRSCDDAERTIARQVREPFDWPDLPQRRLLTVLAPPAALVSAQDASCLPTSGTQTCGLGPFFHGGARRAARGLERSPLAAVEGTRRCALPLAVAQTPPGAEAPQAAQHETRGAFATPQLRAPRHRLPPSVHAHGVDGSSAQKP